ncbi:MAG: NAD-dependent epimerase/dehydratase family protein [Rhodocyclaceae bacterium]
MQRLLIIGCGDVIRRALPWLTRRYRVYATTRNENTASSLRAAGVTPLRADLDRADSLDRLAGIGTLVLHSAPPQEKGLLDLRTRRLVAALARGTMLPRRLIYIGTSGVYGDCGGEWVTESRPVRAQTARATRRTDAENCLRRFGRRNGVAISILRAPGIYAADRLPLERIRRRDPVLNSEEDVYTNHVHAADLARAAALALSRGRSGRAYNACDDSCLKMGDYFDLVADTFDLPRPPRASRHEAQQRLGPMTLSFMQESRRLINRRLKRELRIQLLYPEVAAGLAAARATSSFGR